MVQNELILCNVQSTDMKFIVVNMSQISNSNKDNASPKHTFPYSV